MKKELKMNKKFQFLGIVIINIGIILGLIDLIYGVSLEKSIWMILLGLSVFEIYRE